MAQSSKGTAIEKIGEFLTPLDLVIPEDLSLAEWRKMGIALGRYAERAQWWIGDWWNYGEHTFGAAAAEELPLGYTLGTIRNLASMSKMYEPSRRREELTYTHHAEVAVLDLSEQEILLDRAIAEGLSTRALRAEVQVLRALSAPNPPDPLPPPPPEPDPAIPANSTVKPDAVPPVDDPPTSPPLSPPSAAVTAKERLDEVSGDDGDEGTDDEEEDGLADLVVRLQAERDELKVEVEKQIAEVARLTKKLAEPRAKMTAAEIAVELPRLLKVFPKVYDATAEGDAKSEIEAQVANAASYIAERKRAQRMASRPNLVTPRFKEHLK